MPGKYGVNVQAIEVVRIVEVTVADAYLLSGTIIGTADRLYAPPIRFSDL